jgi:hypothetical protein
MENEQFIEIKGRVVKTIGCSYVDILDNYIKFSSIGIYPQGGCIVVDDSSYVKVSRNKINGSGVGFSGIVVSGNSNLVSIDDNEIYNISIGIDINGAGFVKTKGNIIDLVLSVGIKVQSATKWISDDDVVRRVNQNNFTGVNQASSIFTNNSLSKLRNTIIDDIDSKSLVGFYAAGTSSMELMNPDINGANSYWNKDQAATIKYYFPTYTNV